MERDNAEPGRRSVRVQPSESQFIAHRENHQCPGRALPGNGGLGEGNRELQGRVRDLTRLDGWREISAGNEKELLGRRTLAMRHISMIGRAHAVAPPCYGRVSMPTALTRRRGCPGRDAVR